MTKKTALDYHKDLLGRISFADRGLFRKELRKAFRMLPPEEREELKRWFRTSCLCRVERQQTEAILIALEKHQRR